MFNNCLQSVSHSPIVLRGDFNLPNIDWDLVSPSVSTLATNAFCELHSSGQLSTSVSNRSYSSG